MAKKNSLKSLTKGYTIRQYKRPDGTTYSKFQYSFTIDGKRLYVYGDSPEECKIKAETKAKEYKNGFTRNRNVILENYFEELISNRIRSKQIRLSTAHNRRTLFNARIKPVLGDKKIIDIEKRECKALILDLSERLTTAGTNATISLLKDIFSSAVCDEIIERSPMDGIKSLKRIEPEAQTTIHRSLTDTEIATFLEASKNCHYYNLFRILICSGMRIGEASALKLNDLDYKNNMLTIDQTVTRISNTKVSLGDPKTKCGNRKILLSETMKSIIEDQIKKNEILYPSNSFDPNSLIFRNTSGGLIDEQRVLSCMRQIFKNLNKNGEIVARFTPHSFRSSYISRAVESGISPTVLMEIVGHSDVTMTLGLYNHTTEKRILHESRLVNFAV